MANPYEKISIIPNGVTIILSGEIFCNELSKVVNALNTNPVPKPEKTPSPTPNPGINIPNAIKRLFMKIPYSFISLVFFSNSSLSDFDCSLLKSIFAPKLKEIKKRDIPKAK